MASSEPQAARIFNRARFLSVARVNRVLVVWLIVLAVAYPLYVWQHLRVGLTDGHGVPCGEDFINYWSAARLAWLGHVDTIYQWQDFHLFEQGVVGADLDFYHFSYPPIVPMLLAPLALLPYGPALGAWLLTGWGMFYAGLRAIRPPLSPLALSLAWPAVLYNFVGGQNGMLTAALIGGGLVVLRRRPTLAGLLFGLLSFKPQLAILIPVALVAGRHWRTLAVAGLTSVALVAASVILYGPDPWAAYLTNAAILRKLILENPQGSWPRFVSVFVFMRQLGLGVTAAYVVQALTALSAATGVFILWRRQVSYDVQCAALVVGTFMATPYAMDYDLAVCAFAAVWLMRSYARPQVAVTCLTVIPIVSTTFGKWCGVDLASLMLLPACGLVLTSLRTPPALTPGTDIA